MPLVFGRSVPVPSRRKRSAAEPIAGPSKNAPIEVRIRAVRNYEAGSPFSASGKVDWLRNMSNLLK